MQKKEILNNDIRKKTNLQKQIKLHSMLIYLKDYITNLHEKEERLLKEHKNKYNEFLKITDDIKAIKENAENEKKLFEELEKHGEFIKESQISILEIEHEIIDTYIESCRKLVQIYKLNEDYDE